MTQGPREGRGEGDGREVVGRKKKRGMWSGGGILRGKGRLAAWRDEDMTCPLLDSLAGTGANETGRGEGGGEAEGVGVSESWPVFGAPFGQKKGFVASRLTRSIVYRFLESSLLESHFEV